jgi:hypothetical protein
MSDARPIVKRAGGTWNTALQMKRGDFSSRPLRVHVLNLHQTTVTKPDAVMS